MKKIKSYNQITEEKIEDPWDEQLYSETYTVNIKNLRYDMIDLLKTWCKEYNITPKSSSIRIILYEYYKYVLYPGSDNLYAFFEDDDMDYNEWFNYKLDDLGDENYLKWKQQKIFNI